MIEVGGVPIVGLNLYLKIRDSDRGKIRKIRWFIERLGEDNRWVQIEDAIDSWSLRVEKHYESRRLKVEVALSKDGTATAFSWPILTPAQVEELANKNKSPISISRFEDLLEHLEKVKKELAKKQVELEELLNIPKVRDETRQYREEAEQVLSQTRAEKEATSRLLDEIRKAEKIGEREAELKKARGDLELRQKQQDAAYKKNQARLTKQHEESVGEIGDLRRALHELRLTLDKREKALDAREVELEKAEKALSIAQHEFELDTNLKNKIRTVDAQNALNAALTGELEDGLNLLLQVKKYGLKVDEDVRAAAIEYIDLWIREELPAKTRATRRIEPTKASPYVCPSCNNHYAACACGE